jgi:hypothetical protein
VSRAACTNAHFANNLRGWAAGIYDQSRLTPYAAKTLTTHFTPDKNGNIVHKFGGLNYIEAGYGRNAAVHPAPRSQTRHNNPAMVLVASFFFPLFFSQNIITASCDARLWSKNFGIYGHHCQVPDSCAPAAVGICDR